MMKCPKYIIIDVDGTFTDGSIYYDEKGNEIKKFNTRDAAAIRVAIYWKIKILVVTGRECYATKRRMEDIGITDVFQGIKDKYSFIEDMIKKEGIDKDDILYLGDDVNDLKAMGLAGTVACPSDACPEVKEISDYISIRAGGCGAVRDILESLFRSNNKWDDAISCIYRDGGV